MIQQIYRDLRAFMVRFDNEPGGGFNPKGQDPRDDKYKMASIFGYNPKHIRTNNAAKILEIKDQTGQNTCVCEAGASQKEIDEGVTLSPQMMAAYLKKRGEMTATGTSLSAFQNALRTVGICRKSLLQSNYRLPWEQFADHRVLTSQVMEDALTHKSLSSQVTYDLDVVLQKMDEGRIGHTGCDWYSGYNMSGGLKAPWILTPLKGYYRAGHSFDVVDYDLEFDVSSFGSTEVPKLGLLRRILNGLLGVFEKEEEFGANGREQVVKCLQSYGKNFGDKGYFYIRFSDFKKILKYGVYYNTDIPKNVAGWTSMYNGRAVKEINGPKVYILEAGKKRHIPDEAIMWMLGVTPQSIIEDKDNLLPLVKEGEPISINVLPPHEIDRVRYFVAMQKDEAFMKDRFAKYFPDLFK